MNDTIGCEQPADILMDIISIHQLFGNLSYWSKLSLQPPPHLSRQCPGQGCRCSRIGCRRTTEEYQIPRRLCHPAAAMWDIFVDTTVSPHILFEVGVVHIGLTICTDIQCI